MNKQKNISRLGEEMSEHYDDGERRNAKEFPVQM